MEGRGKSKGREGKEGKKGGKEGGGRGGREKGGKGTDRRVTSRSLRPQESSKLGGECPLGYGPPDVPRESLGSGS